LALQTQLSAAEIRIAGIEGKLTFLTVTGSDMYITGANLHIVNGLGATNGYPTDPRSTDPNLTTVNGTGNLIIGYDGANVFSPGGRSGSHNLVVGDGHTYDSFAGIVGGRDNGILAPYATVSGGRTNVVSSSYGSIVGGAFNTVDGSTGAILGGNGNFASAIDATVAGGNQNSATARFSSVSGGSGVVQATEFGWSAGAFGAAVSGRFVSP
jgi:hypothetical protein